MSTKVDDYNAEREFHALSIAISAEMVQPGVPLISRNNRMIDILLSTPGL